MKKQKNIQLNYMNQNNEKASITAEIADTIVQNVQLKWRKRKTTAGLFLSCFPTTERRRAQWSRREAMKK